MRVFLVKIKIGNRMHKVAVKGPNMIQLVNACDKNNISCQVLKVLGRI